MALVGQPAPVFEQLPSTYDEPVALHDYDGRWLVLLFYPADDDAVSTSELLAFSRSAIDIADLGAAVLALSTDDVHCHNVFVEFVLGRLNFPLASDATHAISRAYGVLRDGMAQRALFIIDPAGIVRYEVVHDLETGRSVEEVARVLHALVTDAPCAADWHPGAPRLLAVR